MTLLVAVALGIGPRAVNAHEIPSSVVLRIFVKQDSTRIRVLVRAPLESMRDIDFPVRTGTPYLDLARSDSLLPTAIGTWILPSVHVYEGDRELRGVVSAMRLSLPSDRAFATFVAARQHLVGPALSETTELPLQGAMVDVAIDYPVGARTSAFTIDPELARLGVRTTTVMTFIALDGGERAFEYAGDPGRVRLDPRWYQASYQFAQIGITHIWDGIDHLLFILCLVLPFRKLRPLIGIVTAFTAAHSITLIASAAGWAPAALWFPPLIEVLIAGSIIYMAIENIFVAARDGTPLLRRRWLLAFAFGLVHGFGFSFALRESLQFAGSHLALSLVSFNIGVEIGQVLLLCLAVPILSLVYRHVVAERVGVIIISAFVTHTAWHWLGERWTSLRQYHIEWTMAGMLPVIRLGMATAIAIGLWVIVGRLIRARGSRIAGDAV